MARISARNPVGTGAFKMTDWSLGQRVLFERNADYYREGLPKSRSDRVPGGPGTAGGACFGYSRARSTFSVIRVPSAKFLEVKRRSGKWPKT